MTMMTEDLHYLSATRLAGLLRAKQLSAREVLRAHLERIDAVNPAINAIVTLTAGPRARARAPSRTGWPRGASLPARCTACRWRTRTTT